MPMRRSDADRPPHLIDVGADQLADVRDLVHERDARRQHRVRRVLASSALAQSITMIGAPVRVNGAYSSLHELARRADPRRR